MKTGLGILLAITTSLMATTPARQADLLPYCEPIHTHDMREGDLATVCPDALSSSPSWSRPMSSAPPLSVSDAISRAHAELQRRALAAKDWEPIEIGLYQSSVNKKWYYTVRWRPVGWKSDDGQQTVTIAVLMNGRVAY